MKKILIVTDAWPPQVSGPVSMQREIIARLEAREYVVRVIEPGQFYTVPLPFYSEIPLALFSRRHVAKVIADFKPDAIHIMTEGPLGWSARSVCMKRGIPFTTWYHTHFQHYVDVRLYTLLRPVYAYLRRFHSTSVRTIVSTESLKRQLESTGFKNVTVVPLGVDGDLFVRNTATVPQQFAKPVFIYIGRLAIEKNPEEFLRLDLPGTKLVIGGGPLLPKLKKKYPKTHFLGRYTVGKDFVEKLSYGDVFIFPSRTETFGMVVLEALSCGIPVAAHDVMGPRDIITNGVDGYLGEDLHEAALKCLELKSEDCRATALKYSWDHSTDVFIKNLQATNG